MTKASRQVREHARTTRPMGGDQHGLGPAGMSAQMLRKWIRQAHQGTTTATLLILNSHQRQMSKVNAQAVRVSAPFRGKNGGRLPAYGGHHGWLATLRP